MEARRVTILLLLLLQFFLFHGASDSDVAQMEKREQEALYSMIQGFVGDYWNGSGLYPDPCGWTPIQGVSCDIFDGLWYVTSVSIGPILENSLSCSQNAKFSPYLFQLQHLKSLTFFNCFASPTTLPSQYWESLSQSLETLEFRSNLGLIGEIPPTIGQLLNLRSLVLAENLLSGQLPQELGNLANLKRMTLSGNRFSGQIPTSLGKNLAKLLILDLSRNSFNGSLQFSLGGLTSLLKLDISNNLLSGSLPVELGDMKSLTLLDLRNNNLTGGLIQSLEGMVSVQDLLLSNNPIGGNLMEIKWEKLVNLTNLDLSNMRLNGEIPQSIDGLNRLRFIALDNNSLSGSISPKLGALPCLNALYLNGNNFSGEIRFPEEFLKRVGRRSALWNNANLCYKSENGPIGVKKCENEQTKVSKYDFDRGNDTGKDAREQSSSHCVNGDLSAVLMLVISVLVQLI